MDLDWRPLLSVAAIALVFVPLELLIPSRRPPTFSWRRTLTDILHVSVGGLLIRLGSLAVIALIFERTGSLGVGTSLPLWLQIPLVLLTADFMLWLAHRITHAVPWLWQFHRIHHSSRHLDWLAAYRVHPVDQIIDSTFMALPSLLLGFSPLALLLYSVMYQWHSILLHSNVRMSLGPLERVIATPRFHHWHHADQPEAYDRNFGGQLVIWDRLFGTAFDPALDVPGRYPERFGVSEPPNENFLVHILAPFFRRPFRWQT